MTYEKARIEDYGFRDYRKVKAIYKVISKIIVGIIFFALYLPILIILIQSINASTDLAVFDKVTLKWYVEIFRHETLTQVIVNTIIVSLVATTIATIAGTFIAIGINALPAKKRQRIIILNNIPLLNADIVTGIGIMLVFSTLLPLFPYIFGFPVLLIAHVFFTLPYVVLSVLPKLKEVDPNIMDAAADLGVKPYKALLKIVIPAVKAGIFSGMLLAFTMSIDDFVISYFTTGNGFDNLSIWIYGSIGRKSLTPAVYAFSTLQTLITLTILFIVNITKHRGKK